MDRPIYEEINRDREFQLLQNGFRVQLDLALKSGEALVKEHQERIAYSLLSAGWGLIPSDHLHDNQIVVSRAVYDAAKRICKQEGGSR